MPSPKYYKNTYFQQRKSQIKDLQSLEEVIEWADAKYSEDDTDTQFKVAYSYLAAAEYLKDLADSQLRRSSDLFHFAGHHLRKVENWRNAGIAYQKAGEAAVMAQDFGWAVRSFARAKQCFADVGDAEEMAEAYVLEQDARRLNARENKKWRRFIVLTIWRWTSMYGQSGSRWLIWLFGISLAFSVIYECLFRCGLLFIQNGHWVPIFSGFYFTVGIITTLGFNEIKVVNTFAQAIVLINLTLGWILLGIGAGMIARRVKER